MRKLHTLHTRQGGFTLIELMIVVAIIGILAAIAIPNFLRFQLRAKSTEGKTNLAAIRTAEEGYQAEFGTYVAAAALPAAPGAAKQVWPAVAAGFNTIGWAPEGEVYFQYDIIANGAPPAPATLYTARATGDLDADTVNQVWGYVKSTAAGANGLVSGVCPATGTYNAVSLANDLLDTVGPCDNVSGQSVF